MTVFRNTYIFKAFLNIFFYIIIIIIIIFCSPYWTPVQKCKVFPFFSKTHTHTHTTQTDTKKQQQQQPWTVPKIAVMMTVQNLAAQASWFQQ